jgi:uncharacterized protein
MSVSERVAGVSNKMLLAIRHRKAFEATEPTAGATVDHLRGKKYALLVTFRRSGEAVPTPVWFGVGPDGRVYFRSELNLGKVKRVRAQPRVLIGPCNSRGKPDGPMLEGRARVLPAEENERAEAAIQSNYGLGRKLYERGADATSLPLVYVEVTP